MVMAIIPGAITVMFTYLIALKLTGKRTLSVVAALVLLGSAIFTTQTGVVEQYALTGMLLAISYWYYLNGSKKGMLAFLGLATATHIIGAVFLLIWLVGHFRDIRAWLKPMWVYILTGVVPYGLLFILMANPDVPKLHAGGLSWQAIYEYFVGGSAVAAPMTLQALPGRLLEVSQIMLLGMGLAVIPFLVAMKKMGRDEKVLLAMVAFTIWFWVTAWYPSVWKYMCFVLPIMAAYVAVGLNRMPAWSKRAVAIGAVVMIVVSGVYFNADEIARENPKASDYYEAVWALPDGAAVVIPRGGAYGFAFHWVIAEGKDLIPLEQFHPYIVTVVDGVAQVEPRPVDQRYRDTLDWLDRRYGVKGDNLFEIIEYAQAQGWEVYYGSPMTPGWRPLMKVECPDSALTKLLDVVREPEDWGVIEWID